MRTAYAKASIRLLEVQTVKDADGFGDPDDGITAYDGLDSTTADRGPFAGNAGDVGLYLHPGRQYFEPYAANTPRTVGGLVIPPYEDRMIEQDPATSIGFRYEIARGGSVPGRDSGANVGVRQSTARSAFLKMAIDFPPAPVGVSNVKSFLDITFSATSQQTPASISQFTPGGPGINATGIRVDGNVPGTSGGPPGTNSVVWTPEVLEGYLTTRFHSPTPHVGEYVVFFSDSYGWGLHEIKTFQGWQSWEVSSETTAISGPPRVDPNLVKLAPKDNSAHFQKVS